jgi:hypothetical protein
MGRGGGAAEVAWNRRRQLRSFISLTMDDRPRNSSFPWALSISTQCCLLVLAQPPGHKKKRASGVIYLPGVGAIVWSDAKRGFTHVLICVSCSKPEVKEQEKNIINIITFTNRWELEEFMPVTHKKHIHISTAEKTTKYRFSEILWIIS